MRGRFIAIEGIDGAGGQTQSKLLVGYLKKKVPVVRLVYPDYGSPMGKTIHAFLHKKIELSKQVQFMLYVGDMMKDIPKIRRALAGGKWVIADRWFGSTLAYQCGKEISVKMGLNFAKLFGLAKPDLNIYLKVSPQVSIKRKIKEKSGQIDRYEANRAFLQGVAKNYSALIKSSVFGKWAVIDAEQPIQKVFEDIKKVLAVLGY